MNPEQAALRASTDQMMAGWRTLLGTFNPIQLGALQMEILTQVENAVRRGDKTTELIYRMSYTCFSDSLCCITEVTDVPSDD